MQLHSGNSPNVNGSVNGRGLKHRKLTRQEAVSLAADLVSGQQQLKPSLEQVCDLLPVVTVAAVRAELKARAAANGNAPLSDEAAYFVAVWSALSSVDREAAVKAMGVAEVWDVLARVVA
jgi:hypothetical protein